MCWSIRARVDAELVELDSSSDKKSAVELKAELCMVAESKGCTMSAE